LSSNFIDKHFGAANVKATSPIT